MVSGSGCSISITKSRLCFLLGIVDQLYFKVGISMCAGECGADDADVLLIHERCDPDDLYAGVWTKTVMGLEVPAMDNDYMTLISTTQSKRHHLQRKAWLLNTLTYNLYILCFHPPTARYAPCKYQ